MITEGKKDVKEGRGERKRETQRKREREEEGKEGNKVGIERDSQRREKKIQNGS